MKMQILCAVFAGALALSACETTGGGYGGGGYGGGGGTRLSQCTRNALIGAGVGQYLQLKERQRQQATPNHPGAYQAPAPVTALPVPTTSELVKPSSVTENTTKHLESSRPRE